MTEFIRIINSPEGVFETVRMGHWFDQEQGQTRRILMFGFLFRDRRLFHAYPNCLMLLGNLLQHAHSGRFDPDEPFLLEIQPAVIRAENMQGWVMDLYICGHGVDTDAARQRLDQILKSMISFFQTCGMFPNAAA